MSYAELQRWREKAREESARFDAYAKGLMAAWKVCPNDETQKRMRGFMHMNRQERIEWIRWVEQRAQFGSPEWCVELVGMTVAAKLGVA